MPTPPGFDHGTKVNRSPHVVILGAGASKAAVPNGDANGNIAPVLAELPEVTGINELLACIDIPQRLAGFEMMYDYLATSGRYPSEQAEIERVTFAYFERLQLPDSPTVYDYLLLALRSQDIVATFNWDPFLIQAFRRNAAVAELPTILHLHGNVGLGLCRQDRVAGFLGDTCLKCDRQFERSRLLYPVHHKNYNQDPFIHGEWAELRRALDRAYMLTIFGYAAPETDVEAMSLLLGTWSANPTFDLAQVNIIDIKPQEELETTWQPFFCRNHFGIHRDATDSWLFHYPRRSCEALASFTLQNRPWGATPFPPVSSIADLHEWVQPLLREERRGQFSGRHWEELGRS